MNSKQKKQFMKICRKTQPQLKRSLVMSLKESYDTVIEDDGFIFALGDVPVCLLAHLDTVHDKEPQQIVISENRMSSPQGIGGDDRCGVYMIKQIIKQHKCSVLFLEDEEIGCVGAEKLAKHPISAGLDFHYMIELDRRGKNDAVFYDCDNPDFTAYIESYGWESAYGSFSDIDTIAPVIGVAAVNLSCGYYNAHTTNEYVELDEMETNINRICFMLSELSDDNKYEYIESANRYGYLWSGNGYNGSSSYAWEDYPSDDWHSRYDYSSSLKGHYSMADDDTRFDIAEEDNWYVKFIYGIEFINEKGDWAYEELIAENKYAAIGKFLTRHPILGYADISDITNYGADDM